MLSVLRYVGGLLAIALVLAFAGGAEAAAGPAPEGARLAVVQWSLLPFRFDLETVDDTGAQPLRLVGGGPSKRPSPETEVAPSWSPDGSRIVFSGLARSIDLGPRGTRLYVSGSNGEGLRPLLGTHGADEPVFAPDGTTVAFARYRFRPKVNRRGERSFVERGASIWFADLAGGAPRRITPVRRGLFMWPRSFSPDGRTLLATRASGTRAPEAVAVELSTGRIGTLLHHAADPVYSPDGSEIALVRERRLELRGKARTTADLFTMKTDGHGLRRLTDSRRDDCYQSWDPSGERLAFVRYLPEVNELTELGVGSAVMEVNADGTCLRTVLHAPPLAALFGAAWQPGPGRGAGRIAC